MSHILIVDDEASICWAFREFLADEGHQVDVAASAEEGLKLAAAGGLDAVVLDVRLPGIDGLSAMRGFREHLGSAPIIVMTAFGNLDTAVRAMEGGAFDYLVKPFDLDQAGAVLERALETGRSPKPQRTLVPTAADTETLIGASPAMQELFKSIALVAPTEVPVLITGESGTGKELVARAIHRHSVRRDGPFLPICLPALSPNLVERELFGHVRGSFTGADRDRDGLLELARGGTVLFDEVGDIPLPLQVKLLRAIEHREMTPVGDARPRQTDVRVIAATNRPLADLMAAGQFREDLYFRLSVFRIHIPPLRERRDDIPALANHFLKQACLAGALEAQLSGDVIDELRRRPWVGNIRELRNAIEHAAIVARGRAIRPEHLPAVLASPAAPPSLGREIQEKATRWAREQVLANGSDAESSALYARYLELVEPPLLRVALEHCKGNRAAAAQMLGIHRATLRQRLRGYGIE
jgi:two-component system nitrogen regulation response regulator GlnG